MTNKEKYTNAFVEALEIGADQVEGEEILKKNYSIEF